ncbi:hypothetical protein UMM65_02675 [Aureibaculum sp. 2210JD6-5]|uniref:hypothetical protein n=1 Tax=Aureibaculum sp. 2210JD6-5 TaxID=3103957 RepID=UPI002AACB278|nr:hypothetical protein [Aureibaculum sp. 2210JD6-5]MDY7394130.1 hypothetical protein [Aureibaculum sp. 2210JD6-5]
MKQVIPFLFIFLFIGCKTITKEEYLTRSCQCIDNIETTDKTELKTEIADCLSDHFVTYIKTASTEIEAYLKEHPDASRQEAQDYLVNKLHIELIDNCPSYKKSHQKLDSL